METPMGRRLAAGITLLAVLSWIRISSAQTAPAQSKNETLDQGTVQMLSNILESLDTFRNDRLRDLEKIRISTPDGNSTTVTRLDDLSQMPSNSSVSEHIKALKEGIMGHNPVKKTFGYKVTVYTSPIGENGKDSKPVVVTQYVGGDMKPTRRADESEDLQESANHPDRQLVHSSESARLPIQLSVLAAGGSDQGSSAAKGAKDHHRNTEHSEASEKGHQNGHHLLTQLAKGHDHERHSAKKDEHHKETEKESHRHDTQAHDKGGASQQGIRERTEIEYYEREHFLDTEYDKAKSGHDKTHGVKEHESHNDHDSHDHKKVHDQENIHNHRIKEEGSSDKTAAIDASSHYIPPLSYPDHPHVVHKDHLLHEGSLAAKEDSESTKLHHSEESKGHKEHNSERDHLSEEKDQGYVDKDKGRRKEGYRERGYKITAEREYFLNDAHHDKGASSHTSGHKLKDEEGAAHASKEGERDRSFVKETKDEEAHDAAYDAKEKKYFDGEAHSEGFESEKNSASSGGKKKEEVVPLAPPVVNYVDPDHHHNPLYPPLPIVYAPSDDGAHAVLAYPPAGLPPPKASSNVAPVPYSNRPVRNRDGDKPQQPLGGYEDIPRKPQQPLGGYDDDDNLESSRGYRGHASYKNRHPLVASIRENVRKEVHSKPPSYAKEEASAENSVPSSENAVRFPDESVKYPKESSEETDFHREEPPQTYTESPDFEHERRRPDSKEVYYQKSHPDTRHSNEQYRHTPKKDTVKFVHEHRQPESKEVYYQKDTLSQPDPTIPNEQYRLIPTKKDVVYLEDSKRKRPPHNGSPHTLQSHRPREQNSRLLYVQGAQNADKLLRNVDRSVYPHIQNGGHPSTVGDIIQEISRYPQSQEVQRYPQRNTNNNNNNNNAELTYAELAQLYNPNSERHIRNQQAHRSPTHQQGNPQSHQQQLIAQYNHLIQKAQQQASQEDQANHRPDLLQLQQVKQQQQGPRPVAELELLQQQTKPPFSPVVLLSRGPPSQKQNQAVDVWYTRPRN